MRLRLQEGRHDRCSKDSPCSTDNARSTEKGKAVKPDHVKCENCVYWKPLLETFGSRKGDPTGYGVCKRYPHGRETEGRILEALSHIHWAVSSAANIDEGDRRNAHKGIDAEGANARTETRDDDWCGEFRAEWPTP